MFSVSIRKKKNASTITCFWDLYKIELLSPVIMTKADTERWGGLPSWGEQPQEVVSGLKNTPNPWVFYYCIQIWRVYTSFPELLKFSLIVSIYKKGDISNVNNCSPIAILPIFPNIFEKVVNNLLIKFFDLNNCMYPVQYGFRTQRSTSDTIY